LAINCNITAQPVIKYKLFNSESSLIRNNSIELHVLKDKITDKINITCDNILLKSDRKSKRKLELQICTNKVIQCFILTEANKLVCDQFEYYLHKLSY